MRYRVELPRAEKGRVVHRLARLKVAKAHPYEFSVADDTVATIPDGATATLIITDVDEAFEPVGAKHELEFVADGKPHGRKGGLHVIPEPDPVPPAPPPPAGMPETAVEPGRTAYEPHMGGVRVMRPKLPDA